MKIRTTFALIPLFLSLLVLVLGCGEEQKAMLKVADVTASVTGSKATIAWKTDVPADSLVEYGTTKSYGKSASDKALKKVHSIELKDLQFKTTYHFRVKSVDESGNEVQSSDFIFATLEEGREGPEPFEVEAVLGIKPTIKTITWRTNETATAVVEYGKDTSYGSSEKVSEADTEHAVELVGLKPETTYHYRIKVTDLDGNTTTSSDFTFKTGAETTSDGAGESVKKISMTAQQFRFSPSTIRVKEGTRVILTIRSVDVTHGFGLPEFRINRRLPPNKEVTVEFVADHSGEFPFLCTVNCGAGHADMNGKLIVEEE